MRTNAFYRKSLWIWSLLVDKKLRKRAADTATITFNKSGILKATKSGFADKDKCLIFFPSHNYITLGAAFPGELLFHMEAVATLYPKVMNY